MNLIICNIFISSIVPFDPKYERIVYGLQQAVEYSMSGGDCPAKYTCRHLGAQKQRDPPIS